MNTHPPGNGDDPRDRGSITPLVIGMMLCLLILGAGVTAAGSAFLAGQRLQHLCDGAAATGAGTLTDNTSGGQPALDAISTYLAVRNSTATTTADLDGATLALTCTDQTPITFGALFGTPTLRRTVTATAHTGYSRT